MTLIHQLLAFLKRDYLLAGSSRLMFVWQVMSVTFAAPMLYYLGRLIQPATSPHLAAFGGDYFAFVILGVATFGFLTAVMGAAAGTLRQEQLIGTLEPLLVAPVSYLTLALGGTLWTTLVAGGQALIYVLLAARVFGADFGHGALGPTAVALVLSTGIYAALGVMAAAFVLVFKHADPLTTVFAAFSSLLGGVFYPTTVLPPALHSLAQVVPLTYTLRAIRLAVLEGYSFAALWQELLILGLFAGLLIPLAGLIFRWAINNAKRAGTLGAY